MAHEEYSLPQIKAHTKKTGFSPIPILADDGAGVPPPYLLQVSEGIPAWHAASQSEALEAAVQHVMQTGVEEPTHPEIAFLAHFALEAAQALRRSVGFTV